MNDLAMIQSADLGAAVANAQPSVREAADIVLCDNNSGAMASLIEHIEKCKPAGNRLYNVKPGESP